MKIIYYSLVFLVGSSVFAQSREQLADVVKNTDVETLKALSFDFHQEYLAREQRIDAYLKSHPEVSRKTLTNGVLREIYDVQPNGEISYYQTLNLTSARTSRAVKLYNGGGLGLNIQGQDMTAFVWDGGGARTTHVEFPNGKVVINDGAALGEHATHVMGTVCAQGLTANLRGNAFDASGIAYDWTDDYSEQASEAATGMLISNQSYWVGANSNEWIYGAYDSRARGFDQIAVAAPYYLGVTAAGNDRSDFSDPVLGPYLSAKYGYNLTRGMQNAKNYLTVGAVKQVLTYSGPASVEMSDFSSWGPTDDGRIKPEVVDKGVNVRSTLDSSDTASGLMSGTSMASPGVTGTATLIQQYYHSVNNAWMRAATLKGLICHTADESGAADGPDYEYGWGLINAEAAANAITAKSNGTAIIDERVLSQGGTYTTTVSISDSSAPLMVSIGWTDPPATANNSTNDPTTKYLKNDLDVRVTKDGVTYYPWTLNPAVPYDPAIRTSDNNVDNFEKIQVDAPVGTYTITVSHKGNLFANNGTSAGTSQNYALIVTGKGVSLHTNDLASDLGFTIYPNPSKGIINVEAAAGVSENFNIQVYDIQGRLITQKQAGSLRASVDISNCSNGVYIVKCIDGSRISTQKIVLSH